MIEPTTYRLDRKQAEFYLGFDDAAEMIDLGVLVLDTRLQAIHDAPRCKHLLIDRHQAYILDDELRQQYHPNGAAMWRWCEGAPELRALLGALGERPNSPLRSEVSK
ncbi:hypothetical protein LCGC14_1991780 [marine sediment metagenome]|uniref:Uncharacterized protein n=1 Tax=marine sediment metagenome TaxID=412755 RepID=A0A0F9FTX1_9ZZZZ